MKFEEYREKLGKAMEELSWMQTTVKDRLDTPAYALLVQASRDKEIALEEFEKLARIFYGW